MRFRDIIETNENQNRTEQSVHPFYSDSERPSTNKGPISANMLDIIKTRSLEDIVEENEQARTILDVANEKIKDVEERIRLTEQYLEGYKKNLEKLYQLKAEMEKMSHAELASLANIFEFGLNYR